jgi:hypothetical protein
LPKNSRVLASVILNLLVEALPSVRTIRLTYPSIRRDGIHRVGDHAKQQSW